MEAGELKEYLLASTPRREGASEFAVGFAVHFFEDFPLPHSPDLLPWELNRGGADSTLRHCEDLTEQRLLQLHHLSLPLPFSWCSSSSPMGTVATTHSLFLLFLAEAPSSWPGVLGVLLRPW